jgi:hypothetical protein
MDPIVVQGVRAETTGPRRPPPGGRAGAYAPVPRLLRLLAAALCALAVAASAILAVAELADGEGAAVAVVSLGLTVCLAVAGVPLLFVGPLRKHLSPRERPPALAAVAALPALCWLTGLWPALSIALGWR